MRTITASSPGKLMLYGDHAVLYDQPCLVTAVDLRMRVSVTLYDSDEVRIRTPMLPQSVILSVSELADGDALPQAIKFVGLAIKKFWRYTNQRFGLKLLTESQFTHAYGLGSSSAVTVATMRALAEAANTTLTLEELFRLSYETVLEAQSGKASGFDVAAATYGGTLYYHVGQPPQPLTVPELPLVVGYSGTKVSTTELVTQVSKLHQRHPKHVNRIMESIGLLVEDARTALEQGDIQTAGALMGFNQAYLQALQVSSDSLDTLINGALRHGAYGAKLSGAGGGDCMIALVSQSCRPKVEAYLTNSPLAGAELLTAAIGAEGVRID